MRSCHFPRRPGAADSRQAEPGGVCRGVTVNICGIRQLESEREMFCSLLNCSRRHSLQVASCLSKKQKIQTQPLSQSPRSPTGVLQSCFAQARKRQLCRPRQAQPQGWQAPGSPTDWPRPGTSSGQQPSITSRQPSHTTRWGLQGLLCSESDTRAATVCPRYVPREPHPDHA